MRACDAAWHARFQERKVATEALAAVEAALHAARPELKARLAGGPAAALPEHHQLDAFYQTVTAAGAQHCACFAPQPAASRLPGSLPAASSTTSSLTW